MKIALIDNYDSFTYNLVHYLEMYNCKVTVYRNDQFELEELQTYTGIVLSPGPGVPSQAGLLLDTIKHYQFSKKILGICLGMQAIAEVFGGNLYNLEQPFHGVSSKTTVEGNTFLYKDVPKTFNAGRYHSWAVAKENFPSCLSVTAWSETGEIMSLQHNSLAICGVQFHPESILTTCGKTIIKNWIDSL